MGKRPPGIKREAKRGPEGTAKIDFGAQLGGAKVTKTMCFLRKIIELRCRNSQMHANSSKSIKNGVVATNRFVATGALFVATAWFLRLFVAAGG